MEETLFHAFSQTFPAIIRNDKLRSESPKQVMNTTGMITMNLTKVGMACRTSRHTARIAAHAFSGLQAAIVQQSEDDPELDDAQIALSRTTESEFTTICTRLEATSGVHECRHGK
ncbi:hypothetical protein [Paraburkholderia humisilvae]|uniref:hypothetical protein n=1 Tax=Paraburkholderia humisilvae TaxID=627669 RepID=UPI0015821A82|nr:hypothetical protein [Paraburkholderia humisilvae]